MRGSTVLYSVYIAYMVFVSASNLFRVLANEPVQLRGSDAIFG